MSVPNKLFGKLPNQSTRILVPCGKCPACLANKANEWAFRLENEFKRSFNAFFVTLTYDDDHLPYDVNGKPCFSKRDVQLFVKRLRKKSETKLKYYATAEYGERYNRPHYHAIIFNLKTKDTYDTLRSTWQNGNVDIGTCTSASIRYTTKYCLKGSATKKGQEEPWRLQSQKLGDNYIKTHKKWHIADKTRFYSVKQDGVKIALPRYYKDKIYNDDDKFKHRIKTEKLSQEREQEFKRDFNYNYRPTNLEGDTPCYRTIQERKVEAYRLYKKKLRTHKL